MTEKEKVLAAIKKEIDKGTDPANGSAFCDINGIPDNVNDEMFYQYIKDQANDDLSNLPPEDKEIINCYLCKQEYKHPSCMTCNMIYAN
jgi:hypothetical protein